MKKTSPFKRIDDKLAAMTEQELVTEREKALQVRPKPRKVYAGFIKQELARRGNKS